MSKTNRWVLAVTMVSAVLLGLFFSMVEGELVMMLFFLCYLLLGTQVWVMSIGNPESKEGVR